MRNRHLRSVFALLLSFPQVSAFGPSDLPSRERRFRGAVALPQNHYLSSSLAAHLVSTNRRYYAADNSLPSLAEAETLIEDEQALRISKVSPPDLSSRRIAKGLSALVAVASIVSVITGFSCFHTPPPASAAPPIAVIAEELGFFPVQSRDGTVTYIPKRVQRESTEQAVQLADYLRSKNVVLFGTYWCPHTSRQKELLGREAFARLDYVECAPKGYRANPKLCIENQVDGYPTWIVLNGREGASPATKQLAGERALAEVAKFAAYSGRFSDELEQVSPPPPIGGSACKQKTIQ